MSLKIMRHIDICGIEVEQIQPKNKNKVYYEEEQDVLILIDLRLMYEFEMFEALCNAK